MEGVALEHFNKLKPSTIPMAQSNSHLSNENYQDASTTATHICIIIKFLLTKQIIDHFLTTAWDHTDSCEKQYQCALAIYILSYISL